VHDILSQTGKNTPLSSMQPFHTIYRIFHRELDDLGIDPFETTSTAIPMSFDAYVPHSPSGEIRYRLKGGCEVLDKLSTV
jgi:hypothetical protein